MDGCRKVVVTGFLVVVVLVDACPEPREVVADDAVVVLVAAFVVVVVVEVEVLVVEVVVVVLEVVGSSTPCGPNFWTRELL